MKLGDPKLSDNESRECVHRTDAQNMSYGHEERKVTGYSWGVLNISTSLLGIATFLGDSARGGSSNKEGSVAMLGRGRDPIYLPMFFPFSTYSYCHHHHHHHHHQCPRGRRAPRSSTFTTSRRYLAISFPIHLHLLSSRFHNCLKKKLSKQILCSIVCVYFF